MSMGAHSRFSDSMETFGLLSPVVLRGQRGRHCLGKELEGVHNSL